MRVGRSRPWRVLPLVAAIAGLLCGCSFTVDGRGSTRHIFTPPTGPDDVVVQVVTNGGYQPPFSHLRTPASHTLLGDGTLILVSDGNYNDALVSLEMATISTAQMSGLLKNADDAGILGPADDYDEPNVTDMPTTFITVNVDETNFGQSVYALYFDDHEDDLPWPAQKWRTQLRDFIGHIDDLAEDTTDYAPDAIVVYRMPADQDPGSAPAAAWPIATAPPESTGSPTCVVIDSDEADILAAAAEDTHADDLWQVGTEAPTRFAMRPMLPGDKGCEK